MKSFLTNIARLFFGKRNSSSLSRGYVLAFDIFIVIFTLFIMPLLRYYPDFEKITLVNFLNRSIPVLIFFITMKPG